MKMHLDRLEVARLLKLERDVNDMALTTFIDHLRGLYGRTHLVYHSPSLPGKSITNPFLLLTYSDDWVDHYKSERYVAIDPVFNLGARSITPIDWSRLPKTKPKVVKLFKEASEARVGQQGLTIPVRGPNASTWALFSATTDDTVAQWEDRRYELTRDLVHVAQFVHQHVVEMHGLKQEPDLNALTRREIVALKWSAEGKTTDEVGFSLGVSRETAKAHLDSARYKLGALNRVHAVAKAIRAGLIS